MPSESYVIPLSKAYEKPRTKRANVAISLIYDFIYKHTRKTKEDVVLSSEVNSYIWKRGIQKPPRRISVNLKIENKKVYVFLKDSKEYSEFLKKGKEQPKEKKISAKPIKENKEITEKKGSSKKEDKEKPKEEHENEKK
jgi:large subunit ribosomal protein L31e